MNALNQEISIISSPLGQIKIISEEGFITTVSFLNEEEELHQSGDRLHQSSIDQLLEYFDGKRVNFDFPIKQRGTDFQQRVWTELLTIPFGERTSYLELSRKLGDVKAIRAVGAANGRNNIAIVVPCHRVIGSDKKLTGYAGGLWRKEWLLKHELKHCPPKEGQLF